MSTSRPVWWRPIVAGSPLARLVVWSAAIAVLVALTAAFDPTWLKPLIQHFVQQRSGRRVDFDALRFRLDGQLAPTVRVRNLAIQNAAWASATATPLIRAGEFEVTFAWASLFRGERLIVTRMRLVDADVDLEQQADGLRNWRVTQPEDRGPGHVRVMALDAQRSRVRYANPGLDLRMSIAPLAAAQRLSGLDALPLTKSLSVRGTRGSLPIDGAFDVSDELTFFDTDRPFALRGEIGVEHARMALQGEARDLLQLAGFELELHATARRPADLSAMLGRQAAALPALPLDLRAHVRKQGPAWSASTLQARIGASDVSGMVEVLDDGRGPPGAGPAPRADAPVQLRATLASRRIDLSEWRVAHSGAGATTEPAAPAAQTARDVPVAPATPMVLDAQIDWQVAMLTGLPWPVLGLHTHAAWRDQRLTLAPLAFMLAGGTASGRVSLAPADSSVELALSGLQLAQLGVRELSGGLNARVALHARGESLATVLPAMGGSVDADLRGATLPASLDAKLGLDGGRWLRSVIAGSAQRSAVRCSSLQVRFENGIGSVRRFALETETVLLNATGSIDLPRRRVAVAITPHRKQRALLALDDTIRVEGAWAVPTITLAPGTDEAEQAPSRC